MAAKRIDIMDLRQLLQLKHKGISNRKIADLLGINRNTVNDYIRVLDQHAMSYLQLLECSDQDLHDLFPTVDTKDQHRYQQLLQHFPDYKKELRKTGCTLYNLWQDYLHIHPDGYRYTQFVNHFNNWIGKVKASGILQHKAAMKLFIDYAGKGLSYTDRETGEPVHVEVFVGILPCSHYTFVRATPSQKRGDLIECINKCLYWLGGVPKAIVSDNVKTIVTKAHKYAPIINKTFKDLAIHYGCVVDATRPYSPQDKALVEGAVNLVYNRIYYPLSKHTFFSLEDLNSAIAELLIQYNNYPFQRKSTTRAQQFAEIEQPQLDSLPGSPYLIRTYKRAKVQKISHIYLSEDKNYYSVPYRYIGRQVEVQYTEEKVEIFFNSDRIARHKRSFRNGHYTTRNEHMPSSHQVYNDWNPAWFEKRAAVIGIHTKAYITRLIMQYTYPEIAYKQAQGILSFAKYYSAQRLEQACKRASLYDRAGYRTIEQILKNNMDLLQEEPTHIHNQIPMHPNIRGSNYYR